MICFSSVRAKGEKKCYTCTKDTCKDFKREPTYEITCDSGASTLCYSKLEFNGISMKNNC